MHLLVLNCKAASRVCQLEIVLPIRGELATLQLACDAVLSDWNCYMELLCVCTILPPAFDESSVRLCYRLVILAPPPPKKKPFPTHPSDSELLP